MEKKESIFEKIGHSLKLEDEQYEESLPREEPSNPNMLQKDQPEKDPNHEEEQEETHASLSVSNVSEKPNTENDTKDTIEDSDEEEGRLIVDVYETDKELIVKSPIAGVDASNLDIDLTTEAITIRGTRPQDENVKPEQYYYKESYWGPFSRSVLLPVEVDPNQADATMKNGILTVRLAKLARSETKLKVKSV